MSGDWTNVGKGEAHGTQKRQTRGDVEKRERRQKSRRWTAYSGLDALQRKIESRLERLECTNFGDALLEGDKDMDEIGNESDEFDAEEDSESDDSISDEDEEDEDDYNAGGKGSKPKKKKKPKRKAQKKLKASKKQGDSSSAGPLKLKPKRQAKPSVAPSKKKRRVRTLSDILLDENARLINSARTAADLAAPDYFSARAPKPRYPPKKICVVYNILAPFKDPESGLPYSNSKAFDQLKEQPPAWVRASANAPFHEAVRIIAEERERARKKLLDCKQT